MDLFHLTQLSPAIEVGLNICYVQTQWKQENTSDSVRNEKQEHVDVGDKSFPLVFAHSVSESNEDIAKLTDHCKVSSLD